MKTNSKIKTVANIEANECRWPFGDPRHADFHFCAAPQVAGRPYCLTHCGMSFEAARARQPAPGAIVGQLPFNRRAA